MGCQAKPRRHSWFFEEVADVGLESYTQPFQYADRRITLSAFEPAEIGLVDLGAVGEFFLREPAFTSQPLQIPCDSCLRVHSSMAPMDRRYLHRL